MGSPALLAIFCGRKFLQLAKDWRFLLLLNGLAWALIFVPPRRDDFLHLKIYAVGEGDAIFVRTPGQKKILIDGGPGEGVVRYLSQDLPFYDRTLDLVVLTHPHTDHLNGLLAVLRRYQVKRVLYNPATPDTIAYREFQRLLAAKNIATWSGWAGEVLRLDEKSTLRVLWPPRRLAGLSPPLDGGEEKGAAAEERTLLGRDPKSGDSAASPLSPASEDPNATSLVLLLSFGDFSALLTDDAPAAVQSWLPVSAADDVEVLKVPHHGATTSLNEAFLEKVAPELAVISVGRNRYGHPTAAVLGAYTTRRIPLLRTDEDGTVEVTSDGRRWFYRTFSSDSR